MDRFRTGFRRPANGGLRASGREQQRSSWQSRHGKGIPPSGGGGAFATLGQRADGESVSFESRAVRRFHALLARGRPVALSQGRGVRPPRWKRTVLRTRRLTLIGCPSAGRGGARRSSPNPKEAPALREGWRMPRNLGSTDDRRRRSIKCSAKYWGAPSRNMRQGESRHTTKSGAPDAGVAQPSRFVHPFLGHSPRHQGCD